MPLTRRPRRGPPAPRGFTIIELLVAATIGLVVVSAVAALLVSQLRAFARTQGAVAVQRDLRLGISLLPLDLRGAARTDADFGSDFAALTATKIELFATLGGTVVCDTLLKDKAQLIVPPAAAPAPTGLPPASLTSFYAEPRAGDTVKVLVRTQTGGVGDVWLTARVAAELTAYPTPTPVTAGLCAGTSTVRPRQALGLVWPASVADTMLQRVRPGTPVRVLRRVKYELYQEGSGRWYLGYSERLPGGWTAREPIAGPYEAQGSGRGPGVSFAYFDSTGAALGAPVAGNQVARVDITIRPRTQVRAGLGADSVVVRDSALIRVALRNRF